ncbi:MAG: hypothetical protein KIT48_12085 [Pseudolabrys sp.]|nr:hypothetical protein [Pseudolabrys sp.]
MSMTDVEAFAETKGHFRQPHRLHRRRAARDHVARAIEALGGRLLIDWGD